MPYAVQIYHIRKALDTFEIPYKKPETMAEGRKANREAYREAYRAGRKRAEKDLVKK